MRRYVQENLDKNESILIDEKAKLSCFFWVCVFITLLTFMTIVIPLFFWFLYLEMRSYNYIVTSKRVMCVRGLFFINTDELLLSKIESVSMNKDFFYNRIIFSGIGTNKISFYFLKKPELIKKKIDTIFDNYRNHGNKEDTDINKLEKLSLLKKKGIITEKEFLEKKKKLLNNI